MIKKYKQFNEGINQYLKGPTKEETWDGIKDLDDEELILKATKVDFLEGVKKGFERMGKAVSSHIVNLAISEACMYGSLDVLKYLIEEQDGDVNGYYEYSLVTAAAYNHVNIIKYLLSKGANVNINHSGPLYKAVDNGCYDCAKVLIEAGSKIEDFVVKLAEEDNNTDFLEFLENYLEKGN